jgi:hypothetical protein
MQDKDIERVGREVSEVIGRTEARKFEYAEISNEAERLGIGDYPTDDQFTEEQITEAIGKLPDYSLRTEVASYSGTKFTPGQMKAFATFVATLGDNAAIESDYRGLKVQRDTTDQERRESALGTLKSKKYENQRKTAANELERRYLAGEIN